MNGRLRVLGAVLLLATSACLSSAQGGSSAASYLGFDRNDYPGDAALPALRKTFRYTSYWLNPPPGETTNSWAGKRAVLREQGFGFLVLFNGHTDAEIKAAASQGQNAAALGAAEGRAAAAAAMREGFPRNVIIFLDQEEGGRLLPEQAAYIFAWIDAVRGAGARPGVYCSGIDVREGSGTINTALDIVERSSSRDRNSERRLFLWIANDQCPPAPGCTLAAPPMTGASIPPVSDFAIVWQYAQSPIRPEFSARCHARPAADGNCYAPGSKIFVDLNTARSPDPSEGAR